MIHSFLAKKCDVNVKSSYDNMIFLDIRISALDLLLNLGAEIEEEKMTPALVAAIGKHIQVQDDSSWVISILRQGDISVRKLE